MGPTNKTDSKSVPRLNSLTFDGSAQAHLEADLTRSSSLSSAQPNYYAGGSSTQSRGAQEADTRQASAYSNPQDAYYYQ